MSGICAGRPFGRREQAFPAFQSVADDGHSAARFLLDTLGRRIASASVGAAVGAVGQGKTTMSAKTLSKGGHSRVVWNKGRLVGQKRPLKPKEVWAIRVRLQMKRSKRDLALFNLAIDSKLRGCDLVARRIDDIATGGRVRDRATIIQHKTGRPVQFEIMEQTRVSLEEWLTARPNDRVPTSSRAASRLSPTSRLGNPPGSSTVGSKAPGWTAPPTGPTRCAAQKAAQIYRKTGNLRAVQLLLGHSKIESTVRYLGVEVNDALTLSEQVEL